MPKLVFRLGRVEIKGENIKKMWIRKFENQSPICLRFEEWCFLMPCAVQNQNFWKDRLFFRLAPIQVSREKLSISTFRDKAFWKIGVGAYLKNKPIYVKIQILYCTNKFSVNWTIAIIGLPCVDIFTFDFNSAQSDRSHNSEHRFGCLKVQQDK